MKKALSILMVIAMLMSFMPIMVSAATLTSGTKIYAGNTYYIYDYDDLKILAELISQGQTGKGATFELKNDIVINHGTFSLDEDNTPLYLGRPITDDTTLTTSVASSTFEGIFDGKNYIISGIYSGTSGLFDVINGATVRNLCIENSLFDLRGSSSASAGALCSKAVDSKVSNIIFKGIIINDGENTGGIIGKATNTSALRCRNRGTVIGADYCGGIIGKITGSTVVWGCVNHGVVESTGNYVGGIAANVIPEADVKRCANPGTVRSTGDYVGGIAGDIKLDVTTMENCYNTGTIIGNDYVGGLGGKFYSTGDNFEDLYGELADLQYEMEWYGDMLQGDKIWIEIWPPAWADDHYLEMMDREAELEAEIAEKAEPYNLLYSYSAGSVEANGDYAGALFGDFSGCVWRYRNVYHSYAYQIKGIQQTGGDKLRISQIRIADSSFVRDTDVSDEYLKGSSFANVLSQNKYAYSLDDNNENNGYVVLNMIATDENEPGYVGVTPVVTNLTIGTTDTITFATDETKTYKFTPETDGDYKITVSAADKAGLDVIVYTNDELTEKTSVTKWGEDFPFSFVDDSILRPSAEFAFEGLVAGDEILIELTDGTNSEGLTSQMSASWMPYFTPSSATITVESTTPVEEEYLFEFGVTAQHIRNKFDMVYYPASFDFSMYDDANIRYSDICANVADLAFGCDTEVVMKYIYDATTLDFVSVYEDFWEGSVEVLEHGSTGETGPDGQEYNYIILKAKFVAVGYANDTAPYYLKFAVVEENFVNSDGTVRKVIDNVPYNEDHLCVWDAWDAGGDSFNFSDSIRFKTSDYETSGHTYDDLLLEDDLIATDVAMPTVTFTPEHARKDDLAYYPCMYESDVDYEDWVRSATGFKDSTTKIQIKVNYDSSTLELVDALPSKELYDLGGTVTIIETGDLYPDDPNNSNIKYAIVQLEFDALDFNEGCLFSLKFRVLEENFLDEEGRPIDLVNSFVADWVVTSNEGKSHDLRYYVSSSYASFDTFGSYEELILADYEPFDPTLLSDVTEVTYVQQEDTRKTFTVKANGRKQMIQFIEPDGGTRTYDRYNKNVKITSYNADGEVVSAMSRDLAYEVWEIYSNMSVGVEIQVRGKENYKWDEVKYSFTIEAYNPVISMELSTTSGKKGAVPATVVADEKTEKVMFKMPNNTSVTVSNYTTDENGNRVFTGKAWMNEDGLNEINVYIRRDNVWKLVGTLEYTVG